MRIGIVGDIHFCTNSSLVRQRGDKYSARLENCVKSVNWAEQIFQVQNCDLEIYLGDFFDASNLNAEEITALKDIKFNSIPKKILVGNHEMGRTDLKISSAHIFLSQLASQTGNVEVIDVPSYTVLEDYALVYIPYILESSRQPLGKYFPMTFQKLKYFVFSHNDIAGINLGKFTSKDGFKLEDINRLSTFFFNGHLHNEFCRDNLINVGNLTGQNFSEDAFSYNHRIYVLHIHDETQETYLECYENPYAFNFYKLDKFSDLDRLKKNSVVTVKCFEEDYNIWKQKLEENSNIFTYRINIIPHVKSDRELKEVRQVLTINHLDEFKNYVIQQLGNTDYVLSELEEICK